MRVLLTGGAGFIGSHTTLELLQANHDVLIVDNFQNASPLVIDRLKRLSNRPFDVVEENISNVAAVTRAAKAFQPDAVVHFAGLKSVAEAEVDPAKYYAQNVGGTAALLEAMERVGCQKIVFSSSATVYGPADSLPIDESHPCAPTNPYGRSKLVCEMMLEDWCRVDPDRGVFALRYFNPVGAHVSGFIGEDPQGKPDNLMPYISQVAVGQRSHLDVFGDDYDTPDGTGVRDYIHVEDLAEAHSKAVDALVRHTGFHPINVGSGQGHSVLDVVRAYEAASGRSVPTKIAPRRPGDVAASYAKADKAKTMLKWQTNRTLANMCATAWNWQSNNPNGYEDAA